VEAGWWAPGINLNDDPAFERLWKSSQRTEQVDIAPARFGPDGESLAVASW
jgi:hypothetical protein